MTTNPRPIGNYGTDVRYPYFLVRCAANNRLYACGRRERDAVGSGLGYYDLTGEIFGPTRTSGLEDFTPRGFLVNESLSLLVYSGEVLLGSGAPEALVITYDLDFVEQNRWTVIADLQNTGMIFPTSDPEVIVGLVNDTPYQLYRFNIVSGTLLDSVELGVVVGQSRLQPDGSIIAVLAGVLTSINPTTLARTPLIDLSSYSEGVSLLA